jgi:hypothetical protein
MKRRFTPSHNARFFKHLPNDAELSTAGLISGLISSILIRYSKHLHSQCRGLKGRCQTVRLAGWQARVTSNARKIGTALGVPGVEVWGVERKTKSAHVLVANDPWQDFSLDA